ncbi:MAG: polyketide synthase dehydratase domain-containing protein, partial [Deltaproteobacteria bacterium]|nr:polyketide synthase dehydratase domain-containing protein [Deltaproteobacteria bacterium]
SVASHFDLPPPECTRPTDLEETGWGVVALGRFLHAVLDRLGVRADAYAGHSIGEWTGMIASGVLPEQAVDDLLVSLRPGSLEVPGVAFAAAGCGSEEAEAAIAGLDRIAVSHDNCPHQVILCGHARSIEVARERLIEQGVICQVLPFRSGFHSPLFADYLEPHRRHFAALPVRPAETPLYSATTCAPYPDTPDAIRALAVEHLVRPLRFRELIEALYARDFRVFVQVGTGSLVGFVDDCLGQRPHLAVSASEERRSGMAQLRNLALALFVEGAAVDMEGLVATPTPRVTVPLSLGSPLIRLDPSLHGLLSARERSGAPVPPDSPILAELGRTMEALSRAGEDVVRALHSREPARWSARRRLSVHTVPALRDHAFFPQPEGWACLSDRYPVVPMTMTLELLLEAAGALAPGQVAVAVEALRVHQWLVVEPMVEVELRAELSEDGWLQVEVVDYAKARIRMAPRWPDPPPPDLGPLWSPRPAPVAAEVLYADRWMFHGPRYQGVVELGPYDDTGIDGVIDPPDAPGAPLDNAGQLLGYWLMVTQDRDQLAMPVGVDSVAWFGPAPPSGAAVRCRVRIRSLDERALRADLELVHQGRLWCRIGGWTDHRFGTDAEVWQVMRQPERNLLSEVRGPWVRFDEGRCRVPSREWLMRRYLGEAERQAMLMAEPQLQRAFLNDRVVAKDALRHLLWTGGTGSLFPVEVPLGIQPSKWVLEGALAARDLRVSVAHVGSVWVALAAEGRAVGIDIAEAGSDPATTRIRCAQRAVAQARGLAPGDDLAHLVVQGGDDRRLVVDGTPVGLVEDGPHLVAWTLE